MNSSISGLFRPFPDGSSRVSGRPFNSQQIESRGGVSPSDRVAVEQFQDHQFADEPDVYPRTNAACTRRFAATARRMHVEHWVPLLIREDRPDSRCLEDIAKRSEHRDDLIRSTVFRADHQLARGVSAAEEEAETVRNALTPGKGLDAFVQDIAVFEPGDKRSALSSRSNSHTAVNPYTCRSLTAFPGGGAPGVQPFPGETSASLRIML